jgi:hypothetical protein
LNFWCSCIWSLINGCGLSVEHVSKCRFHVLSQILLSYALLLAKLAQQASFCAIPILRIYANNSANCMLIVILSLYSSFSLVPFIYTLSENSKLSYPGFYCLF